jgi:hypothetical protein
MNAAPCRAACVRAIAVAGYLLLIVFPFIKILPRG